MGLKQTIIWYQEERAGFPSWYHIVSYSVTSPELLLFFFKPQEVQLRDKERLPTQKIGF